MTSDGDQTGSLIDELDPEDTARQPNEINRARPDAPANLSSQSGMTSDDGDQTGSLIDISGSNDQAGSLIDELEPQDASRPRESADRARPEAPANLSSHSALSSDDGDQTGSIIEDDEQEQKESAGLLREKQASLFGYNRGESETAVTQGNLDFVDEDSASDSDSDVSLDEPKQESNANTAPDVPSLPPPSSSSSKTPVLAIVQNLSDDSDWDSPDVGDEPGAQPSATVQTTAADAVSSSNEPGGLAVNVGSSGQQNTDNNDTLQAADTVNDLHDSDWDSLEPETMETEVGFVQALRR